MIKKITTFSLVHLLLSAIFIGKLSGQVTLVNYDFNAGTSFATLTPTVATNISSSLASTETFTTFGGVASSGAFTNNSTPGSAVAMNNSSGTNTRYFTFSIGGSALPNYKTLKIYFQAQRSGSGASLLTLQYSLNGGAYTAFTTNTMSPASGSFSSATFNLPSVVDNATSIDVRVFASGASGTGTLRLDNFQVQGVLSSTSSTVAIAGQDPNTPTAVNWAIGAADQLFYKASVTSSGGNAVLSSVTANMSGTYMAADIAANGLKLYYSADATLVPAGDVLLGSQTSSKSAATENITWSGLTQTISAGATGYIYATADVDAAATSGRTLAGSFTSNANAVFTPTVNYDAGNSYGATTDKTFLNLPTNPALFAVSCSSEAKVNIDMNAPTTGTVLVFANTTGSFTDPVGAGSSFTGANSNYSSAPAYPAVGGNLVYSGAGSNISVQGVNAGQNYSFKAYSYSGSSWSSGTAVISASTVTQPVSSVVVTPSAGQLQITWNNPASTVCYNNVIIIARQASAVEPIISKATFDGLLSGADFTGANTVWTSNSNSNDVYDLTSSLIGTDNTNFLVYKGTGTSATITGLTNGIAYHFRIFTVDGLGALARWSGGTDVNGTPGLPAYYWNGGNIAALPANGGAGIWGATNAWRQPSASGSQANWANGNPAVFAGTAGAVTLDATRTATSYSFNTSSYTVQTASSTQYGMAGPITLGANNVLVLAPNAGGTANGILAVESVTGTGTASVTIFGNQQGTAAAARINIGVANGAINVPTGIVSSTGNGVAGYVATATGAVVNGNIINNSSLTTCIGATSGYDITMNGVISGSSGLQFSAGASGGAGIAILNNVNTYSGPTKLNGTLTGTLVMGVDNALPASDLIMSFSSGNGGNLDLNGTSQSIGNLSSNFTNNSVITNSSATSNSTLTINQTIAQSFDLAIKDGASRKIALVKNGPAALTLTRSGSTFSGGLTINNGEVRLNPTIASMLLPGCPVTLNGGTLGTTGILATTDLSFSTLKVTDNSTVSLDPSSAHTLSFAASNAVGWTASKTLVITGWQGIYTTSTGSSGTAAQIFVGSGASDLTSTQLSQIKFFDGASYYAAMQLSTGELVPYNDVLTKMQPAYCGYTAESFGEFLRADSVLTAHHYRFLLVNAATSFTQTFNNSSGYPYLTLYTIPGISYNTTYTVTVAWSADSVTWSNYGSPCTITSPLNEVTELKTAFCGYTATHYSDVIQANRVSGATQYEYRLQNSALSYTQTLVKTNNNFNLAQFTGLADGTTYSVTVRVKIFGAWDIYGTSCNVTTPSAVTSTSLQPSSCGLTVSGYSQILFAEVVLGATQYEYRLTNAAQSYSQTFLKTNNNFNLAQFSGLAGNTTYSVAVRANVSGVWGNFGPVCTVTTPSGVISTSLQPAYCGAVASSYSEVLYAVAVANATQYEYRLENAATSYTQTYVKTNNNFNLTQFTGLTNNTTYSVTVRANVNSSWGNFGPVCTVTTPSGVISTSLQPAYCGIVASSYSQVLYAVAVTNATQYEYRLESAATSYTQTYVKTNNNFNLTQFTGIANGTTYSVSVRAYVSGVWGNFGPACTVTTPATSPTTSLQPASCGITLSTYSQVLLATAVTGATQYEYKLENAGLGYSQSYAKSNNNFNFGQFTGLANSTTYAVQVRVYFNGAWGSYGPVCNVTTPASAIMLNGGNQQASRNAAQETGFSNEQNGFDAIAYPNPFNDEFVINLVSYQVNEVVTIRVFDATGRLTEQHTVLPGAVKDMAIGSAYAKGLYNIVVSQGSQSKSIKVIRS